MIIKIERNCRFEELSDELQLKFCDVINSLASMQFFVGKEEKEELTIKTLDNLWEKIENEK